MKKKEVVALAVFGVAYYYFMKANESETLSPHKSILALSAIVLCMASMYFWNENQRAANLESERTGQGHLLETPRQQVTASTLYDVTRLPRGSSLEAAVVRSPGN